MWALHTFVMLLAAIIVLRYTCVGARSAVCDDPPTVENCSIIHRKWSFMPDSRKCEINYVCSRHPNRFDTEQECEAACPSETDHNPPPRDDCSYWIQHLDECKFRRNTFYPDKYGRRQRVLIFRFCGQSSVKLYAYYYNSGECIEIVLRRW
ncbi:uncharacterized protein LOC125940247 [Dermacentor silvarum]|uniref:uncharacterized protein LOC125940247 n=1 Tax=Dermacentor silvarum TaxID=543639 RepID=UPI002100ADE2|nr:uncharacterized protein LOC125940247 [Dermacentor silvarum]